LTEGLFGVDVDVSTIRYQLLHGVAASSTFAAEQRASAALFVVVEFHGSTCLDENLVRNESDLQRFVGLLSLKSDRLRVGQLAGPFTVPGAGKIPAGISLFIGKAIREISVRGV